jgi:hypothetical protein
MKNLITTNEMIEQFGDIPLKFSLYSNKFFVFSGQTYDHKEIMLMLDVNTISELIPNNALTINQFDYILKDKKHIGNKFIRVKILNGVENIYQTLDNRT